MARIPMCFAHLNQRNFGLSADNFEVFGYEVWVQDLHMSIASLMVLANADSLLQFLLKQFTKRLHQICSFPLHSCSGSLSNLLLHGFKFFQFSQNKGIFV